MIHVCLKHGCRLPPRRLRPVRCQNRKTIEAIPPLNRELIAAETKEHIVGFWILEAADMDETLAWAREGALVCGTSGEVRELLFHPSPEAT